MNKRILVFTGSRGEWGYLRPILQRFNELNIKFALVVCNMHLLPEAGFSFKEIEKDGFKIDEKIYMNIVGPDDLVWSKSLGLLGLQMPDIFSRYKPDLLLIAGDRAETFTAAWSAYYADLPIAHIQAGERSGHKDGMVRHAIGKLAHIHFASNFDAADRLRRFGEQEFRIFEVGAPQLDDIYTFNLISRQELEEQLNVDFTEKFALCVVHPTSESVDECKQYVRLISAACMEQNIQQVWIYPNNDGGARDIIHAIENLTGKNLLTFRNLDRVSYLSLMKHSCFIIGNSSSGLLEAPSLRCPAINLGLRQKDRVVAESVIQIEHPDLKKIHDAIELTTNNSFLHILSNVKNPYGSGDSSKKIVQILESIKLNKDIRNKYVTE